MIFVTVGQRIKTARKNAGLTQKELGEKIGVSFQAIAQWETGARNPKHESLKRISDAIGCNFYWLLFGDLSSIEDRSAFTVMRIFNTDDQKVEKAAKVAVHHSECEHRSKGYSFSKDEEELIKIFSSLNVDGKKTAIERVGELAQIPKYQGADTLLEEGKEGAINPQDDK